jgi:Fe-Mn family superoxide dismutase
MQMNFELKSLPYDYDALSPFLSVETLETHHKKHHAGYLAKLDDALDGEEREMSLAGIVQNSEGQVFNLAAQVWNHDFYWDSITSERAEVADDRFKAMISESFGDQATLERELAAVAKGVFGSGWAWLTFDPATGALLVEQTANAKTPLTEGRTPLLTLDVWEHAYYLDYKNDRGSYVDEFIGGYLNWTFAESNLIAALQRLAS